jgi:hypothetical protein
MKSSMKTKWLACTGLALSMALIAPGSALASAGLQQDAPPAGYAQSPDGWDRPPAEFREIQRQGFHDGVEGARKDFDHHRAPNVNDRDEYRHPHVSPSGREDYREGFRRGYEVAMNHLASH